MIIVGLRRKKILFAVVFSLFGLMIGQTVLAAELLEEVGELEEAEERKVDKIEFTPQELQTLLSSRQSFVIVRGEGKMFFRELRNQLARIRKKTSVQRQMHKLASAIVGGATLVEFNDCVEVALYANSVQGNERLQDLAREFLAEVTQISDYLSGKEERHGYAELETRLINLVNICNSEIETLCVDEIKAKSGSSIVINSAIDIVDLCATGTVLTDILESKTTGTVRIPSNVCIDEGMTLSVDKIATKSGKTLSICPDMLNLTVAIGDGAGFAQVDIGRDTVNGAELVVGAGSTTGGSLTVFSPESTNKGVIIEGNEGICIDAALSLSVDKICAKTDAGAIDICSHLCIDEDMTLSVNKIATKSGKILSVCPNVQDLFVEIGEGGRDVRLDIGKDSVLGGKLSVFSPGSSSQGVIIEGNEGICIDAALSLSVDKICAKTNGGAIDICTSLCLDETYTFSVRTIGPKNGTDIRITGTVNIVEGNLDVDGNILVGGFTVHTSDERVKEEVETIDPKTSLDIISKLDAKTYKLSEAFSGVALDKQATQIGFVAQHVRKVMPEVVHHTAQKVLGDKVIDNFLALDYSRMVVHTANAAKALKAQLDESKQEFEDFKAFAQAQIDALAAQVAALTS